MSEETKTAEELAAEKAAQEAKGAKEKQEQEEARKAEEEKLLKLTPEEAVEYIKQLRSEAATRRRENKEYKDKFDEIEKEKEAQKQKDQKAKGKHEDIINELNKKISDLEPKAKEFDEYQNSKKEKIKKSLEEKGLWVESFNNLKLSELEALDEKFKKPANVPTDTSNRFKSGNGKDERSPEEKMQGIYKT